MLDKRLNLTDAVWIDSNHKKYKLEDMTLSHIERCLDKFHKDDEVRNHLEKLKVLKLRNKHLLNFEDYQHEADKTINPGLKPEGEIVNACFGLMGEVGEVVDLAKKNLFQGHELDRDKIKEELGDVLWYLSFMSRIIDIPLYEIAQHNVNKLRARYGEKFDSEKSINRKV